MQSTTKARDRLLEEISTLRRRVEELETRQIGRSRAEEEMAVFRKFAEASGHGLGMARLSGHITYVNPTLAKLLGERRPRDVLGRPFVQYYPKPCRKKLEEEVLPTVLKKGQWVGELVLLSRSGRTIPTLENFFVIRDEEGNPQYFADVIADLTERKQAEEGLRKEHEMLKQMLKSNDRERQLIAYEIHDGIAQQLSGALMQFDTFQRLRADEPNEAWEAHQAGTRMLEQGLSEARRLISGLRPPVLDERGVVAALEHLAGDLRRQKGVAIELSADVEFDRLEPMLENGLFRIAQESVMNACRHSHSEQVRIQLIQQGDEVRLEVRDWGIGFDPENVGQGCFGLRGIRERARLLDGQAEIQSALGRGTRVAVSFPVAANQLRQGPRPK
ncbi:MAG: PAS domain-containing sensor histidine kinase [Planctomycetota bacterium]|jgi:PAS domain S-box-containing protein